MLTPLKFKIYHFAKNSSDENSEHLTARLILTFFLTFKDILRLLHGPVFSQETLIFQREP